MPEATQYPDTTFYFGNTRILNASDELKRRGCFMGLRPLSLTTFAIGDTVFP